MQNLLEDLKYFRQFKCPAIYGNTNKPLIVVILLMQPFNCWKAKALK